ncbi:hypothetical protein QPL79_03625 [Ignisphaera sp. 4213-co]|uniref:DUF47 family protein n=1 Tax=Ignisphaera cupida TaxID=3050454 RepID=A0ABD4Z5K2_9CREN|nr:hypothetical protein [Ignisphaera sp. 4213-co]MDK6028445.1 hypothetical protein [Ignisphaera sp. 4213-co]
MSGDVLSFDVSQLSLAEETIVESLSNITTKAVQLTETIKEILDDIISDRIESARNRIQKAIAIFNNCRDSVLSSYTYLAKVSTTFSYSIHYMNLINNLREVLQDIHKILILMNTTMLSKIKENEKLVIEIQKLFDMVSTYLKTISNYFLAQISKSGKLDELLDMLYKNLNSVESYVHEGLANNLYETLHAYALSSNVIELTESIAKLYEALICLHIAKKS